MCAGSLGRFVTDHFDLIHFVEASFVGIRVQYTVDIGILDKKL